MDQVKGRLALTPTKIKDTTNLSLDTYRRTLNKVDHHNREECHHHKINGGIHKVAPRVVLLLKVDQGQFKDPSKVGLCQDRFHKDVLLEKDHSSSMVALHKGDLHNNNSSSYLVALHNNIPGSHTH